MTVVDTNVIVDLVGDDEQWKQWSLDRLTEALDRGPALINDIIFAELCARYETVAAAEALLPLFELSLERLSRPALFLAGQAFAQYRKAGGAKTNVLPDFFIGAQAVDLGVPLLTRDVGRYRTYFPQADLIAPA